MRRKESRWTFTSLVYIAGPVVRKNVILLVNKGKHPAPENSRRMSTDMMLGSSMCVSNLFKHTLIRKLVQENIHRSPEYYFYRVIFRAELHFKGQILSWSKLH